MLIFNVGPHSIDAEFSPKEHEQFEWVVYWYEYGEYSGDGEAVALDKSSSLLFIQSLCHCSCYGPLESFGGSEGLAKGRQVAPRDYLKENENILDASITLVFDKVKQLLGGPTGASTV